MAETLRPVLLPCPLLLHPLHEQDLSVPHLKES